jgi:hypothetical protein
MNESVFAVVIRLEVRSVSVWGANVNEIKSTMIA